MIVDPPRALLRLWPSQKHATRSYGMRVAQTHKQFNVYVPGLLQTGTQYIRVRVVSHAARTTIHGFGSNGRCRLPLARSKHTHNTSVRFAMSRTTPSALRPLLCMRELEQQSRFVYATYRLYQSAAADLALPAAGHQETSKLL